MDKWPGFVPPQLAFLVDTPPDSEEWIHEIKFDGYRLQPHIKNKTVKLFTRGAHDWSLDFPTLTEALAELDVESAILDGEAVVVDENGRSDFGNLQNALSVKNYANMRIYLFDILYLNGKDIRQLQLKERKELLKTILKKSKAPIFYSDDIKEKGSEFFKMTCKHKLEGIVSKDINAPYSSGRSKLWCKSKCSQRQEFVIGGYTEGKGGRSGGPGALLIGVYDKIKSEKKLRYVGKVGTGFNFKTLMELKKKFTPLELKTSPFEIKSPKGKGLHWITPKLVAEINFSEWTSDKSLRAPVFLGLRTDKQSIEIVEEKPTHLTKDDYAKIEKKNAKEKKIMETTTEENQSEQVALSHPDKILFKDEEITKKMVWDYYDKISHLILPHIKDRPLSLVRCPNGGGQKCFYQKHPGQGVVPKHFKSFKVKEKSSSNLYIAIDNKEGLKQLVQMNAFEIHTWNTHYQTLMNPDQIVMDFDPDPSVDFKAVVKACLLMKKILDQLKLKSFVKVTGGKGIHIHIPIEPIYTWDQVKAFSRALADEMVSQFPKDFIATMSKEARKGKIFVDYLRNGYGSTAVAPYALRASKKSAVALPLEWSELTKIKSSDQFTMAKALQKIKKRKADPWKQFFAIKQRIAILANI